MPAGNAGDSQTFDTTGSYIYYEPKGCTEITVKCMTGSAVSALVKVEGLHSETEYYPIAAGAEQKFRIYRYGIKRVHVKGKSGTATVSWTVSEQ